MCSACLRSAQLAVLLVPKFRQREMAGAVLVAGSAQIEVPLGSVDMVM
jgi:hypothetical protein